MKLHYDYAEAATALGISKSFLEHNIQRLPHRRLGDRVRFSEADLHEISDMHAVRPGQKAESVEQVTPLPAPAPNQLQKLKPRRASRQSA